MGWLSWTLSHALFLLFIHFQLVYRSSLAISFSGPKCHPEERTALLQFSNSTSVNTSDRHRCHSSLTIFPWNTRESCCTWPGVGCDQVTGHVIGLFTDCSGLQGTISSNSSLFLLRHLEVLDLSFNDFRGSSISPKFGQFQDMTHLSLKYSNFSGYVPLEISHLSRLVLFELYESSTQVFGSKSLYMEANTFKGLAQKLTNLTILSLIGVDMSSVPAASLMNLSSSITNSVLQFCKLRGELPEQVFRLPKLQALCLHGNNLTGASPRSNWSSPLETLDLSSNSFTGQIPRSLFNLKQLTRIDLSPNNFVGKLPDYLLMTCQSIQSETFL